MNQLENKISSREVAEMIDMQHKHLLDKIDRINKDLVAENSSTEKYWTEGTFNYNGRDFREFQITKRGCEFLAHKTTGTKGNLFTDKYMDRFSEMEKVIKEGVKSKQIDSTVKEKDVEARLRNSRAREANILLKIANNPNLSKEYVQVLQSKATEIVTGKAMLPLPTLERKTYSATEIGQKLGISANKVGKLANEYNLKTEEYGKLFHDKSKYSNKEVESFRYYEDVIQVLEMLIKA
jgi:phage regulator Rha-like protein